MIKNYSGESAEIYSIFYDSIHNYASRHYGLAEINAWAPSHQAPPLWKWRLELKRPFVYYDGDIPCGFIELDTDGRIDCHYVRSDYARRGIGQMLLDHVHAVVMNNNIKRTYLQASYFAKGLYVKNGYTVVNSNFVNIRGVEIENYSIERHF